MCIIKLGFNYNRVNLIYIVYDLWFCYYYYYYISSSSGYCAYLAAASQPL